MIKQRLHMTPFIICYGLYLISCVIYVLNQIIKYDFFENLKHEFARYLISHYAIKM